MTRPGGCGLRTPGPLQTAGSWLFAAVLCAFALDARAARMYQWTDPQTGTVQLSGHPPPWFRRDDAGPRVRVFERGRIVDDTAYPATQPPAAPPPVTPPAPPMAPLAADPATTRAVPAASDPRAEFKALLEAWDREQAARATQTLPATTGSAAAAPPAQ